MPSENVKSFCVFNWSDMEQFGIIHLTGEADALNRRGLFDLTDEGRELVLGFLNMPDDTKLRPNINSVGVASVALPYSILIDLAVAAYARAGFKTIVINNSAPTAPYVMAIRSDAPGDDVKSFMDAYRDRIEVIRLKSA